MERIKVLCRLILMIAATVLVCTWVTYFYPASAASTSAYEDMEGQFQVIYEKLQVPQDSFLVMSKEEFDTGLSEDEVRLSLEEQMNQSNHTLNFSQETMDEVKTQCVEIYKNQKEIAKDTPLQEQLTFIRMISIGIIALSGCIVALIQYLTKRKKTA